MKKISLIILASVFCLISCSKSEDDPIPEDNSINSIKITVSFTSPGNLKSDLAMTEETPLNYSVALKSATLIGSGATQDFNLISKSTLAASEVFEFTSENIKKLLTTAAIPEGTYNAVKLEIYYLQMRIRIATTNRGIEERNVRIYLSNSAESEGGDFYPGDMTQYADDGSFHGWLFGEGQTPDMDPVQPRENAYRENGGTGNWYNFDDKPGNMFGPFGDVDFMNLFTGGDDIYGITFPFNFTTVNGGDILVDLNVANCWKFQDKSSDGVFGAADLDPLDPTKWHMDLPDVTVSIN